MKILTLTLNPAYDVHAGLHELRVGHENLADTVIRDAGGKGINISRALSANGVANRAIVVLGSENCADFRKSLDSEQLDYTVIEVPGRIRENLTVHTDSGAETRISFRGFKCDSSLLGRVGELICDSTQGAVSQGAISRGDIITFTGSLPVGISPEQTEKFLLGLKSRGVRLVIDSKSVTLGMLRRIKPWLIKPNAEELAAYLGTESPAIPEAAMSLWRGGIENVLISLGGEGAILASGGRLYRAAVPRISTVSTIGAGDSSVAGFIAAYSDGREAAALLRTAAAYGTAACLRGGTRPPLPDGVAKILREIEVIQI